MSDLADQILAVITTVELTGRLGDPPLGFILDGREHHPDDVEIVYETGRGERDAVLRRCAADRELVALHAMDDLGRPACQVCSEVQFSEDRAMDWPCPTLRAVARGYGIQPTPGGDHA